MKQYFCNAELSFAGDPAWNSILQMHHISEYDTGDYCVEVEFDASGRAISGIVLTDQDVGASAWARAISKGISIGELTALESEPHQLWVANFDADGPNRLGGEPPEGFILPSAEFASGYAYVGTLSAHDPAFSILRHDIHLIWPFFLDYHAPIFLDVSDPLQPAVINSDKCFMFDVATGEPKRASSDDIGPVFEENEIIQTLFRERPAEPVYATAPFAMQKTPKVKNIVPDLYEQREDQFVSSGVPIWVQYPEVPLDPRNGEPMLFLCQLSGGPELQSISARPATGSYMDEAQLFQRMDFWGDGVLFVFVSQDGQHVCILAQNS